MSVPTRREPVIPNGWPIDIEPPLGFSRSIGRPRRSRQYTTCDANASFSSHTSISAMPTPRRRSSFGTAKTGPMPISSGSQPTTAYPRRMRRGWTPSDAARSADITSVADAPSDNWEELPAVTVPWPLSVSKTGDNLASPSALVSGRLHSSRSTTCASSPTTAPVRSMRARRTSIGTISPAKKPFACARAVRCWLTSAYSSCASRVTPYLFATTSAVSPMGM